MDNCDWNWNKKWVNVLERRRKIYELWTIWWSICITRTKRKIESICFPP